MRNQWWILGAVALVLVGCGGGKPKQRASVTITGRVTDPAGKPVGAGMLSFAPADPDNQGDRPMVQVQADGTFGVSCLPGRYKVTLVPLPKAAGHVPEGGDVVTPEKAQAGPKGMLKGSTQPSWDIEVKATGNDEFKLQVK